MRMWIHEDMSIIFPSFSHGPGSVSRLSVAGENYLGKRYSFLSELELELESSGLYIDMF